MTAFRTSISSNLMEPVNKLLYLDILNYTTNIFPTNDWSCTRAVGRMQAFVDAAHQAGWSLRAFIDESTTSTEASTKWRSRRAKEVKTGIRNVPQGATVFLGDILKKCGVEVLYSQDADNDDTLAFHAHADGASILSHDKDMFRYIGASYTVYSDYSIHNGILHLTKHHLHEPDATIKRKPSQRPIGAPPAIQTEVHHVHSGVYLRGAPSPLIRALGFNPHGTIAPLRHAMYGLLNYAGPITEEWPEWDATTGTVKWVVNSDIYPHAVPDPELIALLHKPDEAVARFFPNEVFAPQYPPRRSIRRDDWLKHVFAVRCVVYEICVMSNRAGPSLLDLWLEFESQSQHQSHNNPQSNHSDGRFSARKPTKDGISGEKVGGRGPGQERGTRHYAGGSGGRSGGRLNQPFARDREAAKLRGASDGGSWRKNTCANTSTSADSQHGNVDQSLNEAFSSLQVTAPDDAATSQEPYERSELDGCATK